MNPSKILCFLILVSLFSVSSTLKIHEKIEDSQHLGHKWGNSSTNFAPGPSGFNQSNLNNFNGPKNGSLPSNNMWNTATINFPSGNSTYPSYPSYPNNGGGFNNQNNMNGTMRPSGPSGASTSNSNRVTINGKPVEVTRPTYFNTNYAQPGIYNPNPSNQVPSYPSYPSNGTSYNPSYNSNNGTRWHKHQSH